MTNRKQELIKQIEKMEEQLNIPDEIFIGTKERYLMRKTELKAYQLAEKEFAHWLESYQRDMVKKNTHGWWIILENKIKELRQGEKLTQ